jgi:hypothetical protein
MGIISKLFVINRNRGMSVNQQKEEVMTEEKKGKLCKCCVFLGIIVLAVGLLADVIGLGQGGIGPKNIAAIVVGVALIVYGLKGCKIYKCCSK